MWSFSCTNLGLLAALDAAGSNAEWFNHAFSGESIYF
jgi:hypothetical protein